VSGTFRFVRHAEFELVQDLLVLGADEDDDGVTVSMYGGPRNVCASVHFEWHDAEHRQAMLGVLAQWAATDEPVAMLTRGDVVSLVAERSMLRRALDRS
jgi:hypothetical protein